ncbi:TPA: hypothetical protein UL918_000103 [Stenotrophomonas maltophilia]|nr:hypothetical protein [Stenotrophomonas maltophilia]HEL7675775.1 hypothetical protein [Stenotrophomonas maltophilia]
MSVSQSVIALSNQQLAAVRAMVGDMAPPLEGPGRPTCALFLTIVEQFEAALLLVRAGLATHGGVHVRSMLEVLVNLRRLCLDSDHVHRMKFEQLRGEKRLYERMLAFPDLPAEQKAFLDGRLAQCMARYQPIADGLSKAERAASAVDNFTAAGLSDMVMHYTLLCSFSHNDLAALALRHQGETGMTLRARDPEDVVFLVLSLAHFALVCGAEPLPTVARFPDGAFASHMGKMVALQDRVMAHAGMV